MNKNLPPLKVFVNNKFLTNTPGVTPGHLVSVRSLQNQALQFTVLLETGALFTGLPVHAIRFTEDLTPNYPLIDCQMWDNISSDIDVIQLDLLLYMPCTVKLHSGEIITGEYLFSIDYVGKYDLSRHPTHWKMFHAIKNDNGALHLYPQYRIKFLDSALCDTTLPLPAYTWNDTIYRIGS